MAACEKCWSEAVLLAASSGRPAVAHYNQLLPLRQCHQVKPSRQANPEEYVKLSREGRTKRGHIWIAESALGKPLPKGAQVHHVDENKSNNAHSNLVICPSQAYHSLLHLRQRVVDAGGNPNTHLLCSRCKQLKEPSEFDPCREAGTGRQSRCKACKRESWRMARLERAPAPVRRKEEMK